jgi:hypothetical protein
MKNISKFEDFVVGKLVRFVPYNEFRTIPLVNDGKHVGYVYPDSLAMVVGVSDLRGYELPAILGEGNIECKLTGSGLMGSVLLSRSFLEDWVQENE